ncbi:MAG TPA: short-chain dehydrogenase [Gammaproteobacteria bacterium]|jgi:3-oxoacyl-[acyl-carrier protein] reductase|nr:short-chain dehydrogenase [Gammaproteobacteria bacterium]
MGTIIITGASKGIGKATAARFVANGDRVINISRSPSDIQGIENVPIDLAGPGAIDSVDDLVNNLPFDDIHLIHNAARLVNDSIRDVDAESFKAIININIIAPQILNQAILPKMAEGSSIIYIGSTLSEKAVANSYSYVSTKHAMVGMMRATCQDLAGSGIHTACICPGFTDTEMLRAHVGDSNEVLAEIGSMSSYGRLIEPAEIARTIEFATANPVINGSIIHANLGQKES